MYSSEERERSNKRDRGWQGSAHAKICSSATAGAPSTWFSLFHLRRAADVAGVSPVAVLALMYDTELL